MVKMLVCGLISDKNEIQGKTGQTYYSLYVVVGRKVVQVSVPKKIYDTHAINETVSLECDFYVNYDKKFTSIYIKE